MVEMCRKELQYRSWEFFCLLLLVLGILLTPLGLTYYISILIQDYQETPSFVIVVKIGLIVMLLLCFLFAGPFVISRMKALKEGFHKIRIVTRGHATLVNENEASPCILMQQRKKNEIISSDKDIKNVVQNSPDNLESNAVSANMCYLISDEPKAEIRNLQLGVASSKDSNEVGIHNGGFYNTEINCGKYVWDDMKPKKKRRKYEVGLHMENQMKTVFAGNFDDGTENSLYDRNDNDINRNGSQEIIKTVIDSDCELHEVTVENCSHVEKAPISMKPLLLENKNITLSFIDLRTSLTLISPIKSPPPSVRRAHEDQQMMETETSEGNVSRFLEEQPVEDDKLDVTEMQTDNFPEDMNDLPETEMETNDFTEDMNEMPELEGLERLSLSGGGDDDNGNVAIDQYQSPI